MISLPKTLQTRADYDRSVAMTKAGECSAKEALSHFYGLLASRWAYEFDRELAPSEEPDGAMPEYLVIEAESEDGATEAPLRKQSRRTEQAAAAIFNMGYTVTQVEKIITELELL